MCDSIIQVFKETCIHLADKLRTYPLHKQDYDSFNVHNEQQTHLDMYANILIRDKLAELPSVKAIVSEEEDEMITFDKGTYLVAFDPIDGSSNLDLNIPVGTIFSIYTYDIGTSDIKTEPIVSGYVLYGASTIFVLAFNNTVLMYVLNDEKEWVIIDNNVRIPIQTRFYYSINEGNNLPNDVKEYIETFKTSGKYSGRFVGSMVADVHRTLLSGGIFIYPSYDKYPTGRLRQLYEVNPMSHIIETAGGFSYCDLNQNRCLDNPITNIHQKCPIFIGKFS